MEDLEYEDGGVRILSLGRMEQGDSDLGGPHDCFVRTSQQAGT